MTLRATFESFYSACGLVRGGTQEREMRRAFMTGAFICAKSISGSRYPFRASDDLALEATAECESIIQDEV